MGGAGRERSCLSACEGAGGSKLKYLWWLGWTRFAHILWDVGLAQKLEPQTQRHRPRPNKGQMNGSSSQHCPSSRALSLLAPIYVSTFPGQRGK